MRRARWKRKNALCQTLRRRRKVWQIRGSCGSVRRASETPLSLRLTPVLEESGPRMTTAANKQGGQRIDQRPFPLPRVWQMPKACQPALDDLHGRWALPWHTRMAVMPVGADPVSARFCRSAEREPRVLPPTADGGGFAPAPAAQGSSRHRGMDMQRGPPRPRLSSALGMVWTRMPASSRERLVT